MTSDGSPLTDEAGLLLDAYRYDYAGACWWCGRPADSREHKHKRTDVKRMYGSGPWRGEDAIIRGTGGTLRNVQGPNSVELKFAKVLCSDCNSTRSQRADMAYDAFASYLMENTNCILQAGEFSWSSIFPDDWRNGRDLVTAYWLKHIGCALAENGIQVDPSLGTFLDAPGNIEDIPLVLTLEIRDDIAMLHHKTGAGGLWKGDMNYEYSISRGRAWKAWSHWGLSWLRLTYTLEEGIVGSCNFWQEDVPLPRGFNVDPAEIERLLLN